MTNKLLPEPLTEKRFHCIPCNQDFYFDDYIDHMDIHRGEF